MQSLRIAYRNVLRQAKRTALLGGAIAFGFFIFTLLNGFTGGLLENVSENFANISGGHIYISGTEVSSLGSEISVIRDTASAETSLTALQDQILSYNTRSSARTTVIFGSKQATVNLEGIDVIQESDFIDSLKVAEGSKKAFLSNVSGILLPKDVLIDLGIEVGERVVLKTTTINGQQNVGDAVVAASLLSQNFFGPPAATTIGYSHISMLNSLLDMDSNQYQTLNLYLNDLGAIDAATNTLVTTLAQTAKVEPREERSVLPNPNQLGFGGLSRVDETERWQGTKFNVTNLNDNLEGVSALVGIINGIGLVIFSVIILIIMVGIMNSYRMVMIERTAEIGTMRAMGVHKTGIRNIFIWEAVFVALSGVLTGLILALITLAGLSLMNFSTDNAFSLFLNQGHLRFKLSFLGTLGNIVIICMMSVVAVYVPASAAARLQPAEALRAS